jgi:hypothetical protein
MIYFCSVPVWVRTEKKSARRAVFSCAQARRLRDVRLGFEKVEYIFEELCSAIFEGNQIRRHWDDKSEKWYFSVVDVVATLSDSISPLEYWRKLKERLNEEGSETVTKCHALKMIAADGKMRLTDTADTEVMLRLIQSIPSPNAEPFKLWLAKVGYERLEENLCCFDYKNMIYINHVYENT